LANLPRCITNFNNVNIIILTTLFPWLPSTLFAFPAIIFPGVDFNPQLYFKHHIQLVVNNLTRMLYILYKNLKNIQTLSALKSVYYSLFHSIKWMYTCMEWYLVECAIVIPLFVKQKMTNIIISTAKYNAHM
jgi:hypothetical protein